MESYKRNQIEDAIFRTLGAQGARTEELRFRIKRLLVADRKLGCNAHADDEEDRRYAFYSEEQPGSGAEVMFSAYEGFALLAAVVLLEHGWPQARVVRVLRKVRRQFEAAYKQTLKRDPKALFDWDAVVAQARPGMIAADNTHPVFLVIVRLTGSSVSHEGGGAAAVCYGHGGVMEFLRKSSVAGNGAGATFFEFVRLMHTFATNLAVTRPVKRGRPSR
ncbi:MAG: hypothetical protein AB7F39_04810 [Variibacter sp.]